MELGAIRCNCITSSRNSGENISSGHSLSTVCGLELKAVIQNTSVVGSLSCNAHRAFNQLTTEVRLNGICTN
jgi:hypothetical protein